MRNLKISICFLLLALGSAGCEKLFLEPDPLNTPHENFQIFWNDFNKYYAQFTIKNINWDSVYNVYRSKITSSTTHEQLYKIMSKIIEDIDDMHVNLYTPYGNGGRKNIIPNSYPSMRLINPCKYIKCGSPQNSVIEYRVCQNPSIGYMIIPTFSGGGDGLNLIDERYLVIDEILAKWKDLKGIIIDLRWNSGGNAFNSEAVAGRFTDMSRVYAMYREKKGPGREDFTPWKNVTVEPKGNYQFLKPVVILTSRYTASSAEMFVMAMSTLPHVRIVGDTTGGGVGSPIYRELPNGWTYRLSTRYYADSRQRLIEGTGITPDYFVQTSPADSLNGTDRILEKGIEIISSIK